MTENLPRMGRGITWADITAEIAREREEANMLCQPLTDRVLAPVVE